jgi:hypothetical protein
MEKKAILAWLSKKKIIHVQWITLSQKHPGCLTLGIQFQSLISLDYFCENLRRTGHFSRQGETEMLNDSPVVPTGLDPRSSEYAVISTI